LAEKVEGLDVGEKGREEAEMKESGDVVNRREIGESGYVEPAKALWVMPG